MQWKSVYSSAAGNTGARDEMIVCGNEVELSVPSKDNGVVFIDIFPLCSGVYSVCFEL